MTFGNVLGLYMLGAVYLRSQGYSKDTILFMLICVWATNAVDVWRRSANRVPR